MERLILLDRYQTKDNNILFDLQFKDKMTLISGDSGIGKTMLFKAIERDVLLGKNMIICLNYDDIPSGNIEHTLNTVKNKVIVIDNGDISLDKLQRARVSLDNQNQYVIFTHSTEGFIPNDASIAKLNIKNGKGRLEHILLRG